MQERFVEKMGEPKVKHDTVVLADFIQIWCEGHHDAASRHAIHTDAAELGIYGRKAPVLCDECEEHLAYAEKRRAFCPHDPKPFCAHCETHCYKPDERAWQQAMMRYSGPKSWRKGHAIDGIKHVLEGRKWKREMARRASESNTNHTTPH
ncbi:MAG TPA: nitrous oxide-stimulated promoter family protein [Coriobacteriia bacterium]|nr:nitrous oxide-stimulated promoter family protein [Coriobacteriia bacterium]